MANGNHVKLHDSQKGIVFLSILISIFILHKLLYAEEIANIYIRTPDWEEEEVLVQKEQKPISHYTESLHKDDMATLYIRTPDWEEEDSVTEQESVSISRKGQEERQEDAHPLLYLRTPDWEEDSFMEVKPQEIPQKTDIEPSGAEQQPSQASGSTVYLRDPDWEEREKVISETSLRPPNWEGQEAQMDVEDKQESANDEIDDEKDYEVKEFDEEGILSKLDLEFGYERSHLIYKKPDKRDEGDLMGVSVSVLYHDPNAHLVPTWVNMGRVEFRYMYGEMDHKGTQRPTSVLDLDLDNIPLYIFEGRLIAGHNLALFDTSDLTVYSGVGYRYLSEDPSSESEGLGFRRESNYVYWPIGVDFSTSIKGGWSIAAVIEFDGIMGAWEKSHFSDLGQITSGMTVDGTLYTRTGVLDDIIHNQQGYGVRGSLKIEKKGKWIDFIAEPYFSHWNIKTSEQENIKVEGVEFTEEVDSVTYYAVSDVLENDSTEYGAKLLFRY